MIIHRVSIFTRQTEDEYSNYPETMIRTIIMKHITSFVIYLQLCILALTASITGCGDEIFDLAEQANEGIVIGAALVYDGVSSHVIFTDGKGYFRTITVDGMAPPSGGEKICLDSKGRIHIIDITPSIFSYSPEDRQWYISPGDYISIASGNGEVYSIINAGSYYVYRFDRDSGNQWINSGIDITGFTIPPTPLLARDPVTGNVFIEDYPGIDAHLYRLPDLSPFGLTNMPSVPACFAMYNNEAFYMSGDHLYSSLRGQMTVAALTTVTDLIVVDSNTIFAVVDGGACKIHRYDKSISDWTLSYDFSVSSGALNVAVMGNGKLLVGMYGALPPEVNGLYMFDYNTNILTRISTLTTYAATSSR